MKKLVIAIMAIIILSSPFYFSNQVEVGDDTWPRTKSVIVES
ncbi:hypothetical protein [Jeotgalibacillus proteolyticus]|nr:hypothetical protein [Jeotgalibacillus proteolyticus]